MGKTSNEVKRRYNSKVYKKLTIEMKKESKTGFICRMIKEHAQIPSDKKGEN